MFNAEFHSMILKQVLKFSAKYGYYFRCRERLIDCCPNKEKNVIKTISEILYRRTSDRISELNVKDNQFEYFVISINHTLQAILEPVCEDNNILPMIGQQIFNIICRKIVGDDYITKLPKRKKHERY